MTDNMDQARRSWNMSRIKDRNTRPELLVRSALHRLGYRFRLHRQDLPGTPDIVLPKHKTAIFVHGCFWHRHAGCKYAYSPKTRVDFWQRKFLENVRRYERQEQELTQMGWRVHVVWECETSDAGNLIATLSRLLG